MGKIRVGTASWTDPTLLASGWYRPEASTPEKPSIGVGGTARNRATVTMLMALLDG